MPPTLAPDRLAARDLVFEVLRTFGDVRLATAGLSMFPALRPGDTLTVRAAAPEEIGVGDIVTFAVSGGFCTHRVYKKLLLYGEVVLLTRGDANRHTDPLVVKSRLLGRVVGVERGGIARPVPVYRRSLRLAALLLRSFPRLRAAVLAWMS